MPLERASTIQELDERYPLDIDNASQGDDHIRLIKTVLNNDFLYLSGPIKFPTHTQHAMVKSLSQTRDELYKDQLSLFHTLGKSNQRFLGWALCDGATRNHKGIAYPVPNAHGRYLCASDDIAYGTVGGVDKPATHNHGETSGHKLLKGEMPLHTHKAISQSGNSNGMFATSGYPMGTGRHAESITTLATGGNQVHTHTTADAVMNENSYKVNNECQLYIYIGNGYNGY